MPQVRELSDISKGWEDGKGAYQVSSHKSLDSIAPTVKRTASQASALTAMSAVSGYSVRSKVSRGSFLKAARNGVNDAVSIISRGSILTDAPRPKFRQRTQSIETTLSYFDPLAEAEETLSKGNSLAEIRESKEDAGKLSVRASSMDPQESQTSSTQLESKMYLDLHTWIDTDSEAIKGLERRNLTGPGAMTVNFDDLISEKKRHEQRKLDKQARFLIKPGSRRLTIWRTWMVFVVLWAVMMAPFEIAFSWWEPSQAFGILSLLVDIFCIMDMFMNFVTAKIIQGRILTSHKKIAKSYFKTWFLIDTLTNFPWDKVMSQKSGKSRKVMKILKLPKVVRLTRLLRVAREEAHTFGTFFTLAGFLLLAHYYSCLYVVLLIDCDGVENACPSVMDTYAKGLSVGMAILGGNDAWMRFSIEAGGVEAVSDSDHGFKWKSGFGIEMAGVITCLTGFCAMGMLFANIARAMDQQDSHSRKFNERLSNVKAAKNQYGMDHVLYMRARKHFHFVWSCGSDASRALLEDQTLSPDLRRELSHSFYGDLLRKVPFLAMAEDHLVKQLCDYARMEVFSPQDKIIMAGESGTELFFLVSGAVVVQKPDDGTALRRLDEGSFFGEMALFNPESHRTVNVVGISFGWLLVVSLVVLRELCSEELMAAFKAVAVERQHLLPEKLAESMGSQAGSHHRHSSLKLQATESESAEMVQVRLNTALNSQRNSLRSSDYSTCDDRLSFASSIRTTNKSSNLLSPQSPSESCCPSQRVTPRVSCTGGDGSDAVFSSESDARISVRSEKGVTFGGRTSVAINGGGTPSADSRSPPLLATNGGHHNSNEQCSTNGEQLTQAGQTLKRLEEKLDNLAADVTRRLSSLESRLPQPKPAKAKFGTEGFQKSFQHFSHVLSKSPGRSPFISPCSSRRSSVSSERPASPPSHSVSHHGRSQREETDGHKLHTKRLIPPSLVTPPPLYGDEQAVIHEGSDDSPKHSDTESIPGQRENVEHGREADKLEVWKKLISEEVPRQPEQGQPQLGEPAYESTTSCAASNARDDQTPAVAQAVEEAMRDNNSLPHSINND